MFLQQQTFFVFGLSRSGKSATEFLLNKNAQVYIYDEKSNERIERIEKELETLGAVIVEPKEISKIIQICDVLVLSPGIPIDHSIAVTFKRMGKSVVGETELAARYMQCPILAVTGTNGKTTTVSLLESILCQGGYNAKACGNVGTPMLECISLTEEDIAVAEISSFQLETLNSLCPHIAFVLNITQDHLNRHYNMENYIFLKAKLLKNLSACEYAVLNYDDMIVRSFAERTKAKVVYFSVKEKVDGAYYSNGDLFYKGEKIINESDLPLLGMHNIQNVLACITASKILKISTEDIVRALTDFKGIKHRIDEVATINGVTYIDDSKGTNVDATIKAIDSMKQETVLLLGGKNKGYDYKKLFVHIPSSKVVHAILYGENRYELLKCAREQGYSNVTVCKNFTLAVQISRLIATFNQTVLLSPASASFDEFSGYEERGDKFVQMVLADQTEVENKEGCKHVEAQRFLDKTEVENKEGCKHVETQRFLDKKEVENKEGCKHVEAQRFLDQTEVENKEGCKHVEAQTVTYETE